MKVIISPFAGKRPATAHPRDVATLERLRDELRWKIYDIPAVHRRTAERARANVAKLRIDRARRHG